jgi:hypothetical protein
MKNPFKPITAMDIALGAFYIAILGAIYLLVTLNP